MRSAPTITSSRPGSPSYPNEFSARPESYHRRRVVRAARRRTPMIAHGSLRARRHGVGVQLDLGVHDASRPTDHRSAPSLRIISPPRPQDMGHSAGYNRYELPRGVGRRPCVEVRYYCDADSGFPHIHGHGVREHEVEEVLCGPGEDLPAARNSRMKLGRTSAGRYLQVIYVPDENPGSVFVITAYELQGKARKAFRRRQRRKHQ